MSVLLAHIGKIHFFPTGAASRQVFFCNDGGLGLYVQCLLRSPAVFCSFQAESCLKS